MGKIYSYVNKDNGHIKVKRRVNLTDRKNELTVFLDFIWSDNLCQIIRENILSNPLDGVYCLIKKMMKLIMNS